MDHAAHQQHHEPSAVAAASAHAAGHDRHEGHSVAMFRDKFWLSLALTVPTVLLSPEVAGWIGYSIPSLPWIEYYPAILGTAIFLYGGLVFLRGARGELADRKPGMMTLISLAIIVAFVTSWAGTLGFFEVEIWWELATLITIMLLGHWLEMRSIAQAQGALSALAALLPDTAERVTADGTEEVPISALQVSEIVLVRPGARVPADGQIVDGNADVDESMITGESRPVPKQVGDEVIAGTVAAGGSLRVKVTATGDQTALSGIMRMVAQAQASASRAQALADRAAAILFYVALAAGAITLVGWWLLGDPEGALVRTATVLVIACPHALGLAIPLVIAISTSLGAQNGLLVKDRLALERTRTVNTVIFDKTGTLTKGEPVLVDVAATRWTSSAFSGSRPRSRPTRSTRSRARSSMAPGSAVSRPGQPRTSRRWLVAARAPGSTVTTSSSAGPGCCRNSDLAPHPQAADWDQQGRTVLHVVVDGAVAGIVAVEDEIRPESKEAIDDLHAAGIKVAMITGDSQAVADSVARRLGIDEVAAQVLPADKAAAVKRFQEGGRKVAMVGDGVNDAPALATADVGIAIGAGTDVAVESAGIVLVRSDPRDVVAAIELSRATYNKMVQNLIWATGYNLVAIPVAMGLFVPWGIDLPMAVGAIAMSLSTIIVAANAQLLRRLQLRHVPVEPRPRLAPA